MGLLPDQGQHAVAGCGVQPSRIHQAEAAIAIGRIGVVAIPRHTRHIVHDGRPRAENTVEQRRFPDIGPPDEGDNGQPAALKGEERGHRTARLFGG